MTTIEEKLNDLVATAFYKGYDLGRKHGAENTVNRLERRELAYAWIGVGVGALWGFVLGVWLL